MELFLVDLLTSSGMMIFSSSALKEFNLSLLLLAAISSKNSSDMDGLLSVIVFPNGNIFCVKYPDEAGGDPCLPWIWSSVSSLSKCLVNQLSTSSMLSRRSVRPLGNKFLFTILVMS